MASPQALARARRLGPDIDMLEELERALLWLSTWIIHHANHVRPNVDGLKVGGHQASAASAVTITTALLGHALRPEDRILVKPHSGPVFQALLYLLGRQTLGQLKAFRLLGGMQSYPSRTKDTGDVDFSGGSMGLPPAQTVFTSLVQDYVALHAGGAAAERPGRMVAVVGDAELDEGNVYEALLEGWKHGLRNCWWIVDYNRQSLDGVVAEGLFRWIDRTFRALGWNVVTLKYGKRLMEAFATPGGKALKRWINDCPNTLYSALTFQGGAAWRQQIGADIGAEPGVAELLGSYDDAALGRLMTNLGGHCLETLTEAFETYRDDDTPTCFIAYTIKGYGLPFAGHKDNHAGLLTPEQMATFRAECGIDEGDEWRPFAGFAAPEERVRDFLAHLPFFRGGPRRRTSASVPVPDRLPVPALETASTQEAFGRILLEIARSDEALADRIVTTSPDVTVSTNLGPWVGRRGLFAHERRPDVFRDRKVPSAQKWEARRSGQHLELGIAENNFFLLLASLGLAHEVFGERLLPIGTLYDIFITRGLDALNHALYQDARFMLVATPSGLALAPEGGAHQSITTPVIGTAQPGLTYFEPAFADELSEIMRFGFAHMQADDGGSVYLRLSTRKLDQPKREITRALREGIIGGGYWRVKPKKGAKLAIVYSGWVAPEAVEAHRRLRGAGAGLLAVTSADRLFADWRANAEGSLVHRLLAGLAPDAKLVTVLDGHPMTLAWLGSVAGQKVVSLGVDRFGQCGRLPELYRAYGIDAEAIVKAAGR